MYLQNYDLQFSFTLKVWGQTITDEQCVCVAPVHEGIESRLVFPYSKLINQSIIFQTIYKRSCVFHACKYALFNVWAFVV